MASSSSNKRSQGKHDVFLSFRGIDTRNSFTSHLYKAMRRAALVTYMDDKELDRGDQISPTILKAIEASKVSVIIFSEHYADSTWCLEEVAKILECKKMKGQVVIPVFYCIDPSNVRNQTGSYGDAFAEHQKLLKKKARNNELFEDEVGKLQKWKTALKEAANLSGWDSSVTRPESQLVEEIVKDVLRKLNGRLSSSARHLVGIETRIKKVESLVSDGSPDVRFIGIWGMGGIGKTTIAEAVFNHICHQFQGSAFLANAREELERHSIIEVRNRFFSRLLPYSTEECTSTVLNITKERLPYNKVLIVLDDVDSSIKLKDFFSEVVDSFGTGSRIIITSRDKQVLLNVVDSDRIYEVEGLNDHEALQLFSLNAFKKSYPTVCLGHSLKIVNYAKGNPLAVKVLGTSLFGRSEKDWDSALARLDKVPNFEVVSVLRTSYERLERDEQRVFLDIVCFFKGKDRDYVTNILDCCYLSVHFIITSLIDKSLLTISNKKLHMHDLVQEMGWSIIREENDDPRKHSRLWDSEDTYDVLIKKKETGAIESIFLDISRITKVMHLEADAFGGMKHLKLLNLYVPELLFGYKNKVYLPPCGFSSLPEQLRYLHWYRFPASSLAQEFSAENLTEISLPFSRIKKLWTGVKHLGNLRRIDLKYSKILIRLPDLSEAENIESINLEGCESLVKLPSSIGLLSKLEYLNLAFCKNLRSLPSRIHSPLLKILDLSRCSSVKRCPEFSECLVELDLSGTLISELPQSIHKVKALKLLDLTDCSKINEFPKNLRNVEALFMRGNRLEKPFSNLFFSQPCIEELKLERSLTNYREQVCYYDRLQLLRNNYAIYMTCNFIGPILTVSK